MNKWRSSGRTESRNQLKAFVIALIAKIEMQKSSVKDMETRCPNPVDPASVNPNPVDPASVNPNPVDPASVNPDPVDPASVNPNIIYLDSVHPNYQVSANSNPLDPVSVNPNPVESALVNPNLVDLASVIQIQYGSRLTGLTSSEYNVMRWSMKFSGLRDRRG